MDQRAYLLKLVIIFVLLKLSYLLFATVLSEPDYSFQLDNYLEMSMRKDAFWYKNIAENGYPEGALATGSYQQSSWAFFPAYPYTNKALSAALSCEYEMAAFLGSLFFSFAALIGCYLFFSTYWKDPTKAFWASLLVFLFPFHFYFSMFLTEAPFLACLIWSFHFIQKRRWTLAALTLIPLVLLRPNGLLMLLPVFLFYLEREDLLSFRKLKENWKDLIRPVCICIPAAVAIGAYLFYQYKLTGNYLAFSQAQQGWGKEFMFPFAALFRRGDINYQVTSYYVLAVSIFLLFKWKKLPWSFLVLVLISLLLPLTAGSTYSMIRYLSVVFPLFMLLSDMLYKIRFKTPIFILAWLLHMGSFYLWLIDHPLGF